LTSFVQADVDLEDHESLKEAYQTLYDSFVQLNNDYKQSVEVGNKTTDELRIVAEQYARAIRQLESLKVRLKEETESHWRTLHRLEQANERLEQLSGEIEALQALVADLQKASKPNPLLNLQLGIHGGYAFIHRGWTGHAFVRWTPVSIGVFRMGAFSDIGYRTGLDASAGILLAIDFSKH
jgi:hypothetical protein